MNLIPSIHDTKADTVVRTNFQLEIEQSPIRNPHDPFKAIDRDNVLVSDRPEIQELNEYALDLEAKIPVDFDSSYIEFEFQSNRLAYVRNGLLLAKLKYLKLYKEFGDGTFASYCRESLHITRWQVNDMIRAARVTMDLIYAGFDILPTNISQAIALASLKGDRLVESWRKVIANIATDKITHKSIRNLLFPTTELAVTTASIQVPRSLHESIHREAAKLGMSIAEMLQAMFDSFVKDGRDKKKSDNSHLFEMTKKSRKNTQNYKKARDWQLNLFNLN